MSEHIHLQSGHMGSFGSDAEWSEEVRSLEVAG